MNREDLLRVIECNQPCVVIDCTFKEFEDKEYYQLIIYRAGCGIVIWDSETETPYTIKYTDNDNAIIDFGFITSYLKYGEDEKAALVWECLKELSEHTGETLTLSFEEAKEKI